jgi:hypothetical protein
MPPENELTPKQQDAIMMRWFIGLVGAVRVRASV